MDAKDTLERFIEELRRLWPVARGSLCEVAKPCVRAGCADCARGDKHPSFIFSYRKDGKQRCLYVPRELVPPLPRTTATNSPSQMSAKFLTSSGVRPFPLVNHTIKAAAPHSK